MSSMLSRRIFLVLGLMFSFTEAQTFDPATLMYSYVSSNLSMYPDGVPDTVVSINLQGNSFTDISIPYYTDVTHIVVSDNLLVVFPDVTVLNTTLEFLDLSENLITSIPKVLIHPLVKLKELNVELNSITQFPETRGWIGNSLQQLYIGDNPIPSVDEQDLSALPELIMFYIHDAALSDFPIVNLPVIKKLKLKGNNLQVIPKFIQLSQSLEILQLAQNAITHVDVEDLMNIPNLTFLDLSKNPFIIRPPPIMDIVLSLPLLETLDVKRTGLSEIRPDIFRYAPSLKTIKISENPLTTIPDVCYSAVDITLEISENYIICDYKLLPVMIRMKTLDARGVDMFIGDVDGFPCHDPDHLAMKIFRNVNIEELKAIGNKKMMRFRLADADTYHCDHPNVTLAVTGMSQDECGLHCLATEGCTSFHYDYNVGTGTSVCGITQWGRDEMPNVPTFTEIYVAG